MPSASAPRGASYPPIFPKAGDPDSAEPTSEDHNFFKGRALTYYGRWMYKYEQAARKGAVGAILIHKTDMASYPWEVVRNSNSGEKSFLKLDGSLKLKVASWIHLDVARELPAAAGLEL